MITGVQHTHGPGWPSTADWPELRSHLIAVHGDPPDEIDDLSAGPDATALRRRRAEMRHQAHHSALQKAS